MWMMRLLVLSVDDNVSIEMGVAVKCEKHLCKNVRQKGWRRMTIGLSMRFRDRIKRMIVMSMLEGMGCVDSIQIGR